MRSKSYTRILHGPYVDEQDLSTLRIDQLNKIDFSKLWRWMETKSGFLSGNPESPFERALCSLSQVFRRAFMDRPSLDLAWLLSALEALFADSNQGVSNQIADKWRIIANGDIDKKQLRKIVSKVYNYRSRLLHGDIAVPSLVNNSQEVIEKSHEEMQEYKEFALIMILVSLRQCFLRNTDRFIFDYKLE
jgi:hypothetical protein